MDKRKIVRRLLPVIVVVLIAFFGYRWWSGRSLAQTGGLSGSGSIEATEITVSAESAGRIRDVLVNEGDSVQTGQALVQFDDALLKAQRRQAEASLQAAHGTQAAAAAAQAAAQAQLDQVRAGPRSQEVAGQKQAVAAAQGRVSSAEGQLAQVRAAQQAATALRSQAVARFAQVKQGARPETIEGAAAQYQQAVAAVRQAQAEYDKVAWKPDLAGTPQSLALERATLAAEAAKSSYEGLLQGATTPELDQASAGVQQAVAGVIQASAAISQTEAALVTARAGLVGEEARLELLLEGARPEQIRAAEAQVAAAKAQGQAAAGQVALAEASIALIDEQLSRLNVKAPAGGVILTRAVEPGEVALPGGTMVVLADLLRPWVTVYLPEDRYGAVNVGDKVEVTVDSFPGQVFAGTVQRVADKAEFTPRNVQTPAGRQTTVFAVKLAIDNPEGQLKPGMPADVVFVK